MDDCVRRAVTATDRGYAPNYYCGICQIQLPTCSACTNHMKTHSRSRSAPPAMSHASIGTVTLLPLTSQASELVKQGTQDYNTQVTVIRDAVRPKSHTLRLESQPSAPQNKHVCYICQTRCRDSATLKEHSREHAGKAPYACVTCGSMFALYTQLVKHELTHGLPRTYNCDSCTAIFLHKSALVDHHRRHSGSKPHQCVERRPARTWEGSLIQKLQHGSGTKGTIRPEQGARLGSEDMLVARWKLKKDNVTCVLCLKPIPQSCVALRPWDVPARERQNVCSACQLHFPKVPNAAWRRMRMLTPEKRKFQCLYCNATFSSLYHVGAHETEHTVFGHFHVMSAKFHPGKMAAATMSLPITVN